MYSECPKCGEWVATGEAPGRPRCPRCRAALLDPEPVLAGAAEGRVGGRTDVLTASATPAGVISLAAAPGRHRKRLVSPARSGPDSTPHTTTAPRPVIPGYTIEDVRGTGGMGTVYKGRQLSLDRPVALKVMSPHWSADPLFVARFTREAFAAAQLNHANIVQIYDIGSTAEGVRFFSMEYVAGKTLSEEVKDVGRLSPEVAAGYILQAARGLAHAHDRGMIHRDVKPDNLLLDAVGVIKVADLGLVKTPDLDAAADTLDVTTESGLFTLPPDMTGTRIALGTPAYMSPEQCRDAATVDHRADVYSLGATLYALVTGKPPFEGASAVGLMKKQAYETPVPPDQAAAGVPKELSAIILTMMAKEPADRYQSMAGVIAALEGWFGVRRAGGIAPRETYAAELEAAARRFRSSPAAGLRARVLSGFATGCAVASAGLALYGQLGWAFGVAGLLVQATLAYFVLAGYSRRTYLFRRIRHFLSGLSWGDRGAIVAGLGLFALLLNGLGLLDPWIGFGMIGVGLAVAARYGLDRTADAERRPLVAAVHDTLRKLRLDGVAEDDLRLFVARTAGRRWEELFEALFGFEAKLAARAELSRGGRAPTGVKFAAWREPIVAFIDRAEQARKEARERSVLADAERGRLVASGVTSAAATVRAKQSASAMVQKASRLRTYDRPIGTSSSMFQQLVGAAEHPDAAADDGDPPDFLFRAWTHAVGPVVRGLVAVVLFTALTAWVVQNNGFRAEIAAWWDQTAHGNAAAPTPARTDSRLAIPGLDPRLTERIDGVNLGVAGLLLLVSLFHRGPRMGSLALLGAAVAVLGPALGPTALPALRDPPLAALLGTSLALVGFRVGARP